MSLVLLFHYLLLEMFRMLVHSSSGACDLLWIYFMRCVALFDVCWCYGMVRLGWCGILMQAEAEPNHTVTPTHIEPEQHNA
jgi:hypothetical protein